MTKTISAGLQSHISGIVTTLCTCWKITRKDGEIMGFTDLDKDITVDSVIYKAESGFNATAVQSKSDLSVDNMDIEGLITSADITEADILNGLYDYAEVEIFLVNYESIADGVIYVKRGKIGEIKVKRSNFIAELRGLSQHLQQNIGRVYTASCDAILGDSRCGVNMASFTFTASISSVVSQQIITATALTQSSGYFTGGEITFTSGLNNGLKMEVKEFSATKITLALPMPLSLSFGDSFTIKTGCDKSSPTCKSKFNNLINFRGFPSIAGMDKIIETAATATDLR